MKCVINMLKVIKWNLDNSSSRRQKKILYIVNLSYRHSNYQGYIQPNKTDLRNYSKKHSQVMEFEK